MKSGALDETTSNTTNVAATPDTIATEYDRWRTRDANGRAVRSAMSDRALILAPQRERKPMTEILPGQLLYIFGASIFDAALLSWLALLWYRRSVNRLMREARRTQPRRAEQHEPRFLPGLRRLRQSPASSDWQRNGPNPVPALRQPRPGDGSQDRRVRRRRCRVRSRDYRLQILGGVAAAAGRRVARRLVDEAVAGRSDARGAARARSSDRSAPRAFYLLGGAIAICVFTAAGQLLRGTLNTAPLTNIFWASVGLLLRHISRSRSSPLPVGGECAQ